MTNITYALACNYLEFMFLFSNLSLRFTFLNERFSTQVYSHKSHLWFIHFIWKTQNEQKFDEIFFKSWKLQVMEKLWMMRKTPVSLRASSHFGIWIMKFEIAVYFKWSTEFEFLWREKTKSRDKFRHVNYT